MKTIIVTSESQALAKEALNGVANIGFGMLKSKCASVSIYLDVASLLSRPMREASTVK